MDNMNEGMIYNALSESFDESHSNDPINPNHYKTGKFECFEVMMKTIGTEPVMDFCICNAFKYIYRYKKKNGIEDIKKAVWYLNKYLELAEGETN